MRKNWPIILAFCLGTAGVLFIGGVVVFFPTFNDWSFHLNANLASQYGALVGGVSGPLLSLSAFLLLYHGNREQRKEFQHQRFEDRLFQLINHFEVTVNELRYRSSASETELILVGRDIFIELKKQFSDLFSTLQKYYTKWSERELINIAYLLLFYGVSLRTVETTKAVLKNHLTDNEVDDVIKKVRRVKTEYDEKIVFYGGHQSKLGNYFRQMFHIVRYIHETRFLSPEQKYGYVKLLRSLLSNYEQALLFLNSLSIIGYRWKEMGWIEEYSMIKNIPEHFMDPVNPKRYYDKMTFEYEEIRKMTT